MLRKDVLILPVCLAAWWLGLASGHLQVQGCVHSCSAFLTPRRMGCPRVQARKQAGTAAAAAAAATAAATAGGYGSDEEVYAAAKALDTSTGEYDADDQLLGKPK